MSGDFGGNPAGTHELGEGRRPGGTDGIIGGFSPIALEINDPRHDVLLGPAIAQMHLLAQCRNSRRIDET